MGCDIHVFTERREDDQWVCEQEVGPGEYSEDRSYLHTPHIGRNYSLFGVLANVRTEHDLATDPRGIPDDSAQEIRDEHDSWGWDAHSGTHYTRRELQELATTLLLLTDEGSKYALSGIQEILQTFPFDGEPNNQRFVIWFDN